MERGLLHEYRQLVIKTEQVHDSHFASYIVAPFPFHFKLHCTIANWFVIVSLCANLLLKLLTRVVFPFRRCKTGVIMAL